MESSRESVSISKIPHPRLRRDLSRVGEDQAGMPRTFRTLTQPRAGGTSPAVDRGRDARATIFIFSAPPDARLTAAHQTRGTSRYVTRFRYSA